MHSSHPLAHSESVWIVGVVLFLLLVGFIVYCTKKHISLIDLKGFYGHLRMEFKRGSARGNPPADADQPQVKADLTDAQLGKNAKLDASGKNLQLDAKKLKMGEGAEVHLEQK